VSMEIVAALRRGREFIAGHAWGQHRYMTADYSKEAEAEASGWTRYCLIGGMARANDVTTSRFEESATCIVLSSYVRPVAGPYETPATVLIEWNDKKHRTKEQVLELIDRAIAEEEKK
jgi:hypothetical protein